MLVLGFANKIHSPASTSGSSGMWLGYGLAYTVSKHDSQPLLLSNFTLVCTGFPNHLISIISILGMVIGLKPVFYQLMHASNNDKDLLSNGHFHFWKSLARCVTAVDKGIKSMVSMLNLRLSIIMALLDPMLRTEPEVSPPPYSVSHTSLSTFLHKYSLLQHSH